MIHMAHKRRSLRRTNSGFTIVELIIALVVTGLLVGALMNFVLGSLVQSTLESAQSNLLSEAQSALNIINNDIQLSSSADT
ncbi:MAG TPA: prepilin-type N-terminal cleavage/methylation domain-containing protein, partial [Candidatus Saccharimonadales bacterium]